MKKILINARQEEELRVAMVNGNYLYDLDIEPQNTEQKKANIYKGVIKTLEPSLDAAFVDYGFERHGFLPFDDLYKTHNKKDIHLETEIMVQIEKEERGTKGAMLTTLISLAGRYLILKPNRRNANGISRKIEGQERIKLKSLMEKLKIPVGMSSIIRTAGISRNLSELDWDLNYLLKLWDSIKSEFKKSTPLRLIYNEGNIVTKALRDYLRDDINEILIDDEEVFKNAITFAQQVMPDYVNRIKLHDAETNLFNIHRIERQIETAFQRKIKLNSGGSIVIDHTEAMTTVDVNSGQARRGKNIAETALRSNLEAADELARQLRIRDMGGLVVVDFIDMNENDKQKVEHRMRESLKIDRARIHVEKISQLGLMEMSRQRIGASLLESTQTVCPRCNGQGTIRDIESLSLSILRLIDENGAKENTSQIHSKVPIEIAAFLLNEKRDELSKIEKIFNIKVIIVPNPHMNTPEYSVTRIKKNSGSSNNEISSSYQMVPKPKELSITKIISSTILKKFTKPAVSNTRKITAPKNKKMWKQILKFLGIKQSDHKSIEQTDLRKKRRYYNSKKRPRNNTSSRT